ncbi:hypothetical protein ebA5606 [Aromatoleum aromaticum EbN1]|uniref:Uncharacterized protein n=1 Tax=Aromatoleum aromaticum (strain DSM 19018 / LMG 30748 / EbN1) TaxID=76114 RepID=Q5P048_AROAE|nr:hypothetical protein ebA5606 [Aromatoleum aromaticum EbN1]
MNSRPRPTWPLTYRFIPLYSGVAKPLCHSCRSNKKTRRSGFKSLILLEARTVIEPMYTALQAVGLPVLARVSGPLPLGLPLFGAS